MEQGTSSSHVQEGVDSLLHSITDSIKPVFDNVPLDSRVPSIAKLIKPMLDNVPLDSRLHSIIASIKPMFDTVSPLWSGYSIYRVPERLRSVKPEAYTPLIVSIGPFHHGDSRLKTMEHLKTLYLYFLLLRHPEISLDRYVKVLLESETRARNCYAETIPYTKEKFVKMLLLDGCFLLELSRVGITFADSESSNLFDVRFDENGVFYIPSLVVDDRTESFLRNLIALEQTHSKTAIIKDQNQSLSNKIRTISAYVTLMDCLVNTSTDVALLRDQGILHNNQLGDDDEAAQLFNKLRTGIIMNPDEFCFSEVFKSVNAYYHTKWNEWRAMFIREFWSTPWRKTSLLAAIFLLLCTFVQTVCSILQVLPHWSK